MLILTRPNVLTVLLGVYQSFLGGNIKQTSITLTEENTIQYIATISPIQRITMLAYVQIIIMRSLGGDCAMHIFHLLCWHYAFLYLSCSKLCWHNWRTPTHRWFSHNVKLPTSHYHLCLEIIPDPMLIKFLVLSSQLSKRYQILHRKWSQGVLKNLQFIK